MKVITRKIDNYEFYSTVYETREDAERNVEGYKDVVTKTFTKYGDPADGWMIRGPYGWKEDYSEGPNVGKNHELKKVGEIK